MTSLLCQKSRTGTIITENQNLRETLLNETEKIIPYMIKEKKPGTIEDEFSSFAQSESNLGYGKSNLTLKTGTNPLRNSVMFNLPGSAHTSRTAPAAANRSSSQSNNKNYLNINKSTNNYKNRENNASSTQLSSIPPTHSSMSTMSMEKFNSNNFQHEKKRLSRKKLKHVQQQLENRLSLKSATTCDLYKEINNIFEDEKSIAQKMNQRIASHEREKTRKREVIYKNWYRNVYEPMQSGIYNVMLSSDADYARNLRNVKYLEYLNQCNNRGSVFQDDFEPNEYDPIGMHNLDASLAQKLIDPTNLQRRKDDKEVNMINKEIRLPIITKADSPRSDVVWNNWILDQYNSIESNVRAKSAKKCNSSRHASEYNLEWDRGSQNMESILPCKSRITSSDLKLPIE